MATMNTGTHFINASGQHYLPLILQNRTIESGTMIYDWDWADEQLESELCEIGEALRALGISTESDADGLFATEISENEAS